MLSNHLILYRPFSSCPHSFPASGSFPMSRLFASGGQSTGASASASVLPMNIQCWFPLGLTGLISLLSKELSRVFSSITVQKHQFLGTQSSLQSNSHICTWLLEKQWVLKEKQKTYRYICLHTDKHVHIRFRVLGENPGAVRAGRTAAGILPLLSETSPHPDQSQETWVLFLPCHQTAGRLRENPLNLLGFCFFSIFYYFVLNIKPMWDFPGGPVAKTLSSQCRQPTRVNPWSRN